MNIQIKHRYSEEVLFKGKYVSLREAVDDAVLEGVSLLGANLEGANLRWANLEGANLQRANLEGANLEETNLRWANLEGAFLWSARGNNRQVKSLHVGEYDVAYTKDFLQIGCKGFPIEKWKTFNEEDISKMDRKALTEWNNYFKFILQIIELFPAEA